MGYLAEALVFGYVGIISANNYSSKPVSWTFVLAEFIIVIVGRYAAVFLAYYIFSCCPGNKENKLTVRQLAFISYAALIRGAIAFGLSQNLKPTIFGKTNQDSVLVVEVVQSSILSLVIITTVFIGGLTPLVQKLLIP